MMTSFASRSSSAAMIVAVVLCILSRTTQAFGHYSMIDSLIDKRLQQLFSPALSPSWFHPMADFGVAPSLFHHSYDHHPHHRHRGVVDPYYHYLHQMTRPSRSFDRVWDNLLDMMGAASFVEPRELTTKLAERKMSISEDNTKYEIHLGVPDAQRENIHLSVRGNELVVQAERKVPLTKPVEQTKLPASAEAEDKAAQSTALPQGQSSENKCVQHTEEGLEIIEDGCVANSSPATAAVQPIEAKPKELDVSPSSVTSEAKGERYWWMDRRLQLPDDVDVDKIEASFRDGMLTIVMPKKTPAPEVEHQILIQ